MRSHFLIVVVLLSILLCSTNMMAKDLLTATDVLHMKSVSEVAIHPQATWVAYTLTLPRDLTDQAGRAYHELYLVSAENGKVKPFITGEVRVNSPKWKPDGSEIAFLSQRGKNKYTQIWIIPASGGEARQVSKAKSNILSFQWHPSENKIAYIATTPISEKEKQLKELGYNFIYYQENLKHRNIYLLDLDISVQSKRTQQLTDNRTFWDLVFSPDGKQIAGSASDKNLIDHRYMFRKIYLVDISKKTVSQLTDNPGKLGNYSFSPDGGMLAYAASLTREDHQVSQAYVIDIKKRKTKNLTIADFKGHINWVGWQDNQTVIYRAGEGVWPTLSLVNVSGGDRQVILNSMDFNIAFGTPRMNKSGEFYAFTASSSSHPDEVYLWKRGDEIKRLTNSNPWLDQKTLGHQQIVHYLSRDNWKIEGLLIKPVGYQKNRSYPLVVYVHGGPESHYSNGWVTSYSRPGQVLAGKGYVVFYPNYRASTGYGVKFAMEGYEDPAGKEFDDIADGIQYLINEGIADGQRIGLAGGSYGGYASAWFATYYTKLVNAVCMFVGISDLISKRGTTDIPYEELYVHSGKRLEEMWQLSLERSPIYYAHQSKTAVLIYGGAADTRVHPSQSLELYWRLRMNDHPAVRLVQYPGEGHGNARQPGRADVIYRQIDWLDWYVYDNKPLDGPMPPLDISEKYNLELK